MRHNLHQLPALVRLLHAHGVHELQVQRLANEADMAGAPAALIPIHRHNALAELRPADRPLAEAVFARARRTAERLGLRLQLPRLDAAPRPAGMPARQRCDWPWDQTYITGAGEVLPCCMVGTADRARFGNVIGADGRVADAAVAAVWHGDAARAFRTQLLAAAAGQGAAPAVCQGCALYHGRF
jgi:MoaA/NifB/PqqE/SkfB family radical SAM enzyme